MSVDLQKNLPERRHKIRKTFVFKISVASVVLALLCVGIISAFNVVLYRNSTIEFYSEKVGSIALSVASAVDAQAIVILAEAEPDEHWRHIQSHLDTVWDGMDILTFLYVMLPYDDESFVYFASATMPELHGIVEDPEIYGPEPWDAMRYGRVITTEPQDAGEWGILISGFAPVYDAAGRAVAIVGADIDIAFVNAQVVRFIRNNVLIGLITAIFIGAVIKLFAVRALAVSLRRAVAIDFTSAKDISSFKARKSDKDAKSEIGVLYAHFHEMLATFHTLQTDMSVMLDKHLKGQYEYRLDESKYKGEQQKLVAGTNALVNMYVNDFTELLEVFKQYGEGNFSANVSQYSENWQWANKIVDDLRAGFMHLTSEMKKLVENAAQGKLDVPADVGSQQGEWAQLIDSLNKLLASVNEPLSDIEHNIAIMSQGDFSRLQGEYPGTFGVLKDACNLVNDATETYIKEISETLHAIAKGDLTVSLDQEYVGSYAPIETAINTILESLNSTISDVQDVVDQVTHGAEQISANAMNLADGAAKQSGAIENLSNSITLIHEKAMLASGDAISASENSVRAQDYVATGGDAVKSMESTMNKVRDSSESIGKIIDVISSISFQTNLLALNASVEAARAGEHGKGFAVVAEEVRNLAGRSQKSASDTAELIKQDVENVEEGLRATNDVVTAFETIADKIGEISSLISGIAEISGEQLDSISNINTSVSEITMVANDTSATAEESASASQELTSQAELLRQKVAFFKLKN